MNLGDNSPQTSKIVQRSGNPGYEQNMPLIVGLEGKANLGQKVKFGGFSMVAATKATTGGNCIVKGQTDNAYENSVLLKFGSGTQVTCTAPRFDTIDAFKAYCLKDISNLRIIEQFMAQFNYLGVWGNVDVNNA